MPIRHNNHQIEDASRRQFDRLLPDEWVSRPKSSDYGTDLEVEIFETDGTATGLMFYVQLRGTDDTKKETSTTLSLEQLRYFHQLDVPTLLVRFCRPTSKFHYKWHFEIHPTPKQETQESLTVNFSGNQRWSDDTLPALASDLKIARRAKKLNAHGFISLKVDSSNLGASKTFELKLAIQQATEICGTIVPADTLPDDRHLPLLISQMGSSITIRCGKLTEIEIPKGVLGDELCTTLLYGACIVSSDLGCTHQAQAIANTILQNKLIAADQFLAFRAAFALRSAPADLVSFALLNGLEDPSSPANPMLTVTLVSASQKSHTRDWLNVWYDAVRQFAIQNDMQGPAAATFYNQGNVALQTENFADAVWYYNQARKLRSEYLTTDYFLQEFGGALYNSRHYRPASKLYESAITDTSSATDWHRLGDAQLLSGEIELATKSYETAEGSQRLSPEKFSSQMKLSLCDWLLEKYGENLVVRWHEASKMLRRIEVLNAQQEQEYQKVLVEANALDLVSNFNVGTSCANRSEFEDALHHFSLCGIQCPHDLEAWSNAIKCAWNIDHHTFFAVLSAAYAHNALDGYALFRSDLANQGMSDNLIEMLDALVGELDDPTQVSDEFSKFLQRHFSDGETV